jgi:hypothetical protein
MNIFYLHNDPKICAEMHADKHVVKMILEYCQLLSTAHRVIDGYESTGKSTSGRVMRRWVLSDMRESHLYKATHINHPSGLWVRKSFENYSWLHSLLVQLCKEYTYRYGKIHKCQESGLVDLLADAPKNMKSDLFTEPTPAMPEPVKIKGDSVASYRNYYKMNKQHLASWKGKLNSRPTPEWFMS